MKTLNLKYFGVTFWSLGVTWCHRNVAIGLVESTFLLVVNDDHTSILQKYGDTGLQRFWSHEFDLLGQVTSSVIIGGLGICGSYWWSIVTMHLSCTVKEILGPKYIGVTTVTFWHRSRDHQTRRGHFPIGGQWWRCIYLARIRRYEARKILG